MLNFNNIYELLRNPNVIYVSYDMSRQSEFINTFQLRREMLTTIFESIKKEKENTCNK